MQSASLKKPSYARLNDGARSTSGMVENNTSVKAFLSIDIRAQTSPADTNSAATWKPSNGVKRALQDVIPVLSGASRLIK